jgi:hypothetical protein
MIYALGDLYKLFFYFKRFGKGSHVDQLNVNLIKLPNSPSCSALALFKSGLRHKCLFLSEALFQSIASILGIFSKIET